MKVKELCKLIENKFTEKGNADGARRYKDFIYDLSYDIHHMLHQYITQVLCVKCPDTLIQDTKLNDPMLQTLLFLTDKIDLFKYENNIEFLSDDLKAIFTDRLRHRKLSNIPTYTCNENCLAINDIKDRAVKNDRPN